ncbi:ubiquitin-binding SDF ubiquitin ligase complex subunit met30 [Dipsacomyces acuminosporus]|nr:ubiquitin-binding SDF ubiquitin ligase complex subunit met30 [Dipsacomyces acuminosporus]
MYIAKIESLDRYELDDELMEFYVSLVATTDMSPSATGWCYKTYTLDKDQYMKVVLREEQMMISQGTTGLQAWEASLRLADFFAEHPDIIRGMHVIELGAGCGLAGFTCAALGATHVMSTDFNPDVLKLLKHNKEQNVSFKDKLQITELDWASTDECSKLSKSADVIIGADITYDPTIVPVLVAALKELLVSSQQVAYITATIRNEETFDLFLQLIENDDTEDKEMSSTLSTTYSPANTGYITTDAKQRIHINPDDTAAQSPSLTDISDGNSTGGSRKRNYTEFLGGASKSSNMELDILSLRKYPAFGGRCYRHSTQVYLAECDNTQRELQNSLLALPKIEQKKISGIWSDFASEPAEHRLLILQGIVNLCCIPQLSYLNKVVPQQLRVDFLAAAPPDISLQILSYLDAKSLCQAAQVSRTWAALANDDILWHRMCAQHIDKVCKKCGWGLPLLDKSSKRVYEATTRRALRLASSSNASNSAAVDFQPRNKPFNGAPAVGPSVSSSYTFALATANVAIDTGDAESDTSSNSSQAGTDENDNPSTSTVRKGVTSVFGSGSRNSSHKPKRRPWKEIFAERQIIANNWRKFRYHESRVQAHADGILCVQFNDEYMITGSYDSKVHVWDAETFELTCELTGHTMPVRALEFDECKLFSGSLDGTVKIWNYRDGTCIRTLRVFESGGVISLHHQNGTLVVGGENGSIRVYNIAKMTSFTLTGHTDWVNAVRLYGNHTLFSCSDDMLVKQWDLEQRRCVRTFTGHSHHVQSLQLSSCAPSASALSSSQSSSFGRHNLNKYADNAKPYLITGSLDSTMRVWDIETGECLDTIFGHVEGIWSMAFDSLRIVSGSNDGVVKLWDTSSHACLFTLQASQAAVNCVAISDTRIVIGDNDGNVRVCDFRNGAPSAQ